MAAIISDGVRSFHFSLVSCYVTLLVVSFLFLRTRVKMWNNSVVFFPCSNNGTVNSIIFICATASSNDPDFFESSRGHEQNISPLRLNEDVDPKNVFFLV